MQTRRTTRQNRNQSCAATAIPNATAPAATTASGDKAASSAIKLRMRFLLCLETTIARLLRGVQEPGCLADECYDAFLSTTRLPVFLAAGLAVVLALSAFTTRTEPSAMSARSHTIVCTRGS